MDPHCQGPGSPEQTRQKKIEISRNDLFWEPHDGLSFIATRLRETKVLDGEGRNVAAGLLGALQGGANAVQDSTVDVAAFLQGAFANAAKHHVDADVVALRVMRC